LVGAHGMLILNANGAYTYVVNNADPAVDALNSGQFLTDTFTYTISDGHGGTDQAELRVTINGTNDVTSINHAPVLTPASPVLATITEDQTSTSGQTVASFIGTSISDVDSGALKGIAITADSSQNGSWQYSLNGTSWSGIGAVSDAQSLLL